MSNEYLLIDNSFVVDLSFSDVTEALSFKIDVQQKNADKKRELHVQEPRRVLHFTGNCSCFSITIAPLLCLECFLPCIS